MRFDTAHQLRRFAHGHRRLSVRLILAMLVAMTSGVCSQKVMAQTQSPQPSRPVLFIHGICGDSSDWQTLRSFFVADIHKDNPILYPGPPDGSAVDPINYDVYYDGTRVNFLLNGNPVDESVIPASTRIFSIKFYDPNGGAFNTSEVAQVSILNKADELAHVIHEITRITRIKDVILIAHSMGGLVARAYLENMASVPSCYNYILGVPNYFSGVCAPGSSRYQGDVAELITLDTPHGGSDLALLDIPFLGAVLPCLPNVSTTKTEMVPGSQLLQSLNYFDTRVATASLIPTEIQVQSIESFFTDLGTILTTIGWPDGIQTDSVVGFNHQSMELSLNTVAANGAQFTDWGNPYTVEQISPQAPCTVLSLPVLHLLPCVGQQADTQNLVHLIVKPVEGGTVDSITVQATVNSGNGAVPWIGNAQYHLEPSGIIGGPLPSPGTSVPNTFPGVPVGSYQVVYDGGGPSSVIGQPIVSPATVTLDSANWNPTFTIAFVQRIGPQPTATSVTIVGASQVTVGTPVNFTAKVNSSFGTPTGSVIFKDGTNSLGAGVLDNSGTATLSTSFSALGTHSVTANYLGDLNFNASTSAAITITVQVQPVLPTLTSLTISPSSVTSGSTAVITATLSGPAPSGGAQVNLTSGNASAFPAPSFIMVSAGQTSASSAPVLAATVATATSVSVSGSFNNSFQSANVLINPNSTIAVQLTLNATQTTVTSGQPVLLTASLSGANGPAPTGVIHFMDTFNGSATQLGTASLTTGSGSGQYLASFTTSFSSLGQHQLTVIYNGDTHYSSQISTVVTVTVQQQQQGTAALASFTISPSTVVGGATAQGVVALTAPAPVGGATVTFVSNITHFVPNPSPVTIPAGALGAQVQFPTTVTGGPQPIQITASYNNISAFGFLTLEPVAVTAIEFSQINIIGGNTVTVKVDLNGPAPAGGATVSLSSSVPAAFNFSAPFSVIVPAGATSMTTTASTFAVASPTSVGVTATLNSSSVTESVTVIPAAPISIIGFTLSPSTVTSGQSSTATVTLSGPAPSGGLSIVVNTGGSIANATSPLVIPAGSVSAQFTVTTSTVTTQIATTMGLFLNGQLQASAVLIINPPPIPVVNLSVGLLQFPSQAIGTTGSMSVTLTNTGSGTMSITSNSTIIGTNAGDFSIGSGTSCVSGLPIAPQGGNCVVVIAFTPTVSGSRGPATLQIFDSAPGSPHAVNLVGIGAIVAAPTVTAVSSSLTNPVYGQTVTVTATVTANGGPATSGTVTLFDGSLQIGTGLVNSSGQVSLATSALSAGAHSIKANYGGNSNFLASSGTFGLTVSPAVLTVGAANSTRAFGAANPAFTFTVSGFVNGDTQSVVTGTPTVTTTATPTSAPGAYPITPTLGTLNAANYSFIFANGSLTVTRAGASVAIASSNLNANANTPVTFTATLTSATTGIPSGTVTFFDGATQIGIGTLLNGVATFTTSTLATGTHSITGQYVGDTNFTGATSTAITEVITVAIAPTTTVVSVLPASPVYGQTTTVTASVTSAGNPVTSGTVTFLDGSTQIGTASLNSSGQAALQTTSLKAGQHTIQASFGGSSTFGASAGTTSAIVAPALLTVTATNANRVFGAANPSLTFSITGFVNGESQASVVTGAPNVTTTAVATSAPGTYPITVTTGNLAAANYTFIFVNGTLTVSKAGTTATITSSNPSAALNSAVTFTVTVTSATTGIATGSVTFLDGSSVLGSGAIDGSGKAVFTTSSLAVGSHSITGQYAGDVNFTGSITIALVETISSTVASTTTTVSPSPASPVYGQSVNLTATVLAGSTAVTSGTVSFFDGSTQIGSGTLNASGQATIQTSTLTAGQHSIQASFGGSAGFTTSSGTTTVTVARAPLTVTASNASRVFGAANPTFTSVIAGFVNGDTQASAVTGSPSLLTTATATSAPGTYPITAALGTLSAANYSFTFANGTLTVTKAGASVAVTSSNLNAPVNTSVTFTATVTSATTGIPSGSVAFIDGATQIGTSALSTGVATFTTSALSVGTHSITAQYAGDTNFTGSVSLALSEIVSGVPAVTLSAPSLTFANQTVGTTSATQSVTVTNSGSGSLAISHISVAGANIADFAITGGSTCPVNGGTVPAGANCTVVVTFTPIASGARSASVTVSDNAAGSPHSVSLTGTASDLTVGVAPGGSTSATITAGQSANFALQISPVNGFSGNVTLSCSGAPAASTCSPNPSTLTLTNVAVPFTVNVSTTARSTEVPNRRPRLFFPTGMVPVWLVSILGLIGIFSFTNKRIAGRRFVSVVVIVFLLGFSLTSCGSINGPSQPPAQTGTPPGISSLTVTAVSGGATRTILLTLNVQ